MFRLSKEHYYQVAEWERFDWLSHGFGTKDAALPAGNLATVKQVHGPDVLIVNQPGAQGPGDGLISNTAGVLVGVRTADCIPILLVDPVHKAVGAVHAGWRGTVLGIARLATELMAAKFGSEAREIEAAIGPGIGLCCFEVGPEVARAFGPWESEQKTYLDLSRINAEQLQRAGVGRIHESRLCTMCGTGFYSYRREKEQAGRMLAFAGRLQ